MAGRQAEGLEGAIAAVSAAIIRFSSNKGFNEQNTKASLILPMLHALGWHTEDADEVHWEYRRKPKSDPVDFALLLQRAPCLFLEAKALRESLDDHKMVKQVLGYAVEAGVQWVVLTNGDEYRVYNAIAPVPVEDKVFRTVSIARDPVDVVVATLNLLSKANLQDKKISRLWESHFVDRQVKTAIEELMRPDSPSEHMVQAVRKVMAGRLSTEDIRASLQRVRIHLDFPVEPEDRDRPVRSPRQLEKVDGAPIGDARSAIGPPGKSVSLKMLLDGGVIRAPVELFSEYMGQNLRARIESDGSITYKGVRYDSPSTAGGVARMPFHSGKLKDGQRPQTNGWVFWRLRDSISGEEIQLSELRERLKD